MTNFLSLPIFILIGLFAALGIIALLIVVILYIQKFAVRKISKDIERAHKDLSERIRFSIEPKSIQLSLGVEDLLELAVEIWRMEQRIAKASINLQENQKKGLESSIQKLKRYLERYDIQMIDYTNQKYNEGLNLDVLSIEKDPSITEAIVKETIEPTVMCRGQIVKKAKIIILTNG